MEVLYKTVYTFENGEKLEFNTNAATRQKLLSLAKHYNASVNEGVILVSETSFRDVVEELDAFVQDKVPESFDFKSW